MRIETVANGPETELLTQFLDFQRATVVMKAEGLSRLQMAQIHPPSTLSWAIDITRLTWANRTLVGAVSHAIARDFPHCC